eukprot:SAG31_NODE_16222_length_718_cov_0.660743_1_plen_38_part_10
MQQLMSTSETAKLDLLVPSVILFIDGVALAPPTYPKI